MGDKFRRVTRLRFAKRIDANSYGPRLRYGQIKIKKGLAKCGALFYHLHGSGGDVPNGNCSQAINVQAICPLVSTFCFSSSFIFLTVGSWLALPVV
jgi:hypothetical protein